MKALSTMLSTDMPAVASVTLVFVQGDDVGIAHILGDHAFVPALAEELMEVGDK